ncbi:MAG TPA: ATP-binding protein [Ramlibacter sp.]|nr:ATP-binding protein [Ramlibacter sp.]
MSASDDPVSGKAKPRLWRLVGGATLDAPGAASAPSPDGNLEERLLASEARLQLAAEVAGMGVWQGDPASGRTVWWPGMQAVHGLPRGTEPLPLEQYEQLVHPDDREQVRRMLGDTTARRASQRLEYRVVWPDGSIHWIEGRAQLMAEPAGAPAVLAGVCVDITRRKQVEFHLDLLARASEELAMLGDYQDTLQRIAHLVVPGFADWCTVDMLEADGSLYRLAAAHADPAKERLAKELHARYAPDAQAATGPWNVLRTGAGELVAEITDEMLAHAIEDPAVLQAVHTLGLRSYIGVPLAVPGRSLGVMSFMTAGSSRRYGAQDLALAEDLGRRAAVALHNARLLQALKESDRAKDVFLATLAHELRNPLAPLRNGLSIIKLAPQDGRRVLQTTEIMERQVSQLSRLVDDLLDVSRISTGKIELRKEPTNLVHVLASAVETSRPHIEAAHHKLSISFAEASTELVADPVRLAQVFSNLLNNAAKYTRPGGNIEVRVDSLHSHLEVRVRDNGIGIPPDMLDKVFGLFTQVTHPVQRRQGGLGIGLSLVDGLVRLHGGMVEARSDGPGHGSEFIVTLPREAGGSHAAAPVPSAPSLVAGPSRRVLVVDDNVDAAATVAQLLQMFGNETMVVQDGLSAVESTATFRPDVVLLDIGLPDINGYEVARRIRQLAGVRQPLLIALTGWGQQQDKQFAALAGFDQHWTKPVDPQRLRELSTRGIARL